MGAYRWLVRILRGSSEAEVVAMFLVAELESPRYGDVIRGLLAEAGADESLLRGPDLDDAAENLLRESVLERHRAWSSLEGLFSGFPRNVAWSLVVLGREEVLSVLYNDWDWWLKLSGGTRLPVDAAARIRASEVPGQTAEEGRADRRAPPLTGAAPAAQSSPSPTARSSCCSRATSA
jgi:hypothetical protein